MIRKCTLPQKVENSQVWLASPWVVFSYDLSFKHGIYVYFYRLMLQIASFILCWLKCRRKILPPISTTCRIKHERVECGAKILRIVRKMQPIKTEMKRLAYVINSGDYVRADDLRRLLRAIRCTEKQYAYSLIANTRWELMRWRMRRTGNTRRHW